MTVSMLRRPLGLRLSALCALLLAGILALTGCSSSESSSPADKTIAISFPNYSRTPALQVEMEAAKLEAERLGYTLVLDDPGADLDRQVSTIKTWIPQGYAAILAVALDATALNGVAKQATDAGIAWVTYGSSLDNQTGEIDMQQTAGGNVIAGLAADWFNAELGGQGKVALLSYEEAEWARERREAIEATLREKAPGVEIVARQDALSQTEGLDATATILQAHPDLNAVLAVSEAASVGAYGALPDKNSPTMFIGGIDGDKEALEAIAIDGSAYRGSAALDLEALGTNMVTTAVNAATGEGDPIYRVTYLPVTQGSPELEQMLALWN